MHKLACGPIEDSDQPAHPFSLIRVIDERSMGARRQESNNSSCSNVRPRLRGYMYKSFSMLNSAEHEIDPAHKC